LKGEEKQSDEEEEVKTQKNQKKPWYSAGKGKTTHNVCTIQLLDDRKWRKGVPFDDRKWFLKA